jgi:D-alanyl-D-alanine carboxypeptidase
MLSACLIFLGVIINIYAVANRILPQDQDQSLRVISTPPLTTSEPNSSQLLATPSNTNIPNSPSGISPRFGHLPYADAKVEELIVISSYGQREYQRFERLMPDAAFALMKMLYAARDDGVWIIPASAFRDFKKQQELFDNVTSANLMCKRKRERLSWIISPFSPQCLYAGSTLHPFAE